MIEFVWKMYLVQIRETKKIIIACKLIIMLLCAFLIQGEETISYYCVLTGGFMQLALRRIDYSKMFYMLPQNKKNIKRFLVWNCRISTGIDVVIVLLTSILINICSNGGWDQTICIRLFLTLSLMHNCLYTANLPSEFCMEKKILAAWCIIGAVINSFIGLVGLQFDESLRFVWLAFGILSLILSECFMRICTNGVRFGDYDEDREILGKRSGDYGRATN